MNLNKKFYWAVVQIPFGCSVSGGIISDNVTVYYINESVIPVLSAYTEKLPKNLGGFRPINRPNCRTLKLSADTIARLIRKESEHWAQVYDEDYSNTFRRNFAEGLARDKEMTLNALGFLDFRTPPTEKAKAWPAI